MIDVRNEQRAADAKPKHKATGREEAYTARQQQGKADKRPTKTKCDITIYQTEQGWKCPACSRLFQTRKSFSSHYRQAHGIVEVERQAAGGSLQCDKCDKTFRSQAWLNRHKREVHDDTEREDLKCEKCDKRFRDRGTLTKHMRDAHPEDGALHTCAECGKVCRSRGGLKQHMNLTHNKQ